MKRHSKRHLPVAESLFDGVLQTARGGDGDELVTHQPRHRLPPAEQELRCVTPEMDTPSVTKMHYLWSTVLVVFLENHQYDESRSRWQT